MIARQPNTDRNGRWFSPQTVQAVWEVSVALDAILDDSCVVIRELGVGHAERTKDVFLSELAQRLTADPFYDLRQHDVPEAHVQVLLPDREVAAALARYHPEQSGVAGVVPLPGTREVSKVIAAETTGMVDDVPDRDGIAQVG